MLYAFCSVTFLLNCLLNYEYYAQYRHEVRPCRVSCSLAPSTSASRYRYHGCILFLSVTIEFYASWRKKKFHKITSFSSQSHQMAMQIVIFHYIFGHCIIVTASFSTVAPDSYLAAICALALMYRHHLLTLSLSSASAQKIEIDYIPWLNNINILGMNLPGLGIAPHCGLALSTRFRPLSLHGP